MPSAVKIDWYSAWNVWLFIQFSVCFAAINILAVQRSLFADIVVSKITNSHHQSKPKNKLEKRENMRKCSMNKTSSSNLDCARISDCDRRSIEIRIGMQGCVTNARRSKVCWPTEISTQMSYKRVFWGEVEARHVLDVVAHLPAAVD